MHADAQKQFHAKWRKKAKLSLLLKLILSNILTRKTLSYLEGQLHKALQFISTPTSLPTAFSRNSFISLTPVHLTVACIDTAEINKTSHSANLNGESKWRDDWRIIEKVKLLESCSFKTDLSAKPTLTSLSLWIAVGPTAPRTMNSTRPIGCRHKIKKVTDKSGKSFHYTTSFFPPFSQLGGNCA